MKAKKDMDAVRGIQRSMRKKALEVIMINDYESNFVRC